MNQYDRSYNYRPGVELAQDRKFVIIDSIISDGGDRITGYIPQSVTQFARELRVSVKTVKSVWFRYCEEMRTSARPIGGLTSEKLKEDDRELIDVLKLHSPSTTIYEIIEELEQLGGQQNFNVGRFTIHKKQATFRSSVFKKKLTKVAMERFTPYNLFYTQMFINYVSSKDPRRLEFSDEAGIKIPDVGTAYGHIAKGSRCVEVGRKLESPNPTLSMLVSLNGPEYYNAHFLSFRKRGS